MAKAESLTRDQWQAMADIAGAWETLYGLQSRCLVSGPTIAMPVVRETLACCSAKGFTPTHDPQVAAAAAAGRIGQISRAPGRDRTVSG